MSVYYRYGRPVTADEALSVPCPLCRQPAETACVYIWPKQVDPTYADPDNPLRRYLSRGTRDLIARVGVPTQKPHNDRRTLFSLRRVRGERTRQRALLRQWLGQYGDIFEEEK